jgi:farnesyl diphosphate synthase
MTDPPISDPFGVRLASVASDVGAILDRLLGAGAPAGEIARPARLLEAMRYATLGNGKRLRPFLLVEAARACGAMGEGVLRAAAAVELVHCYSLVHDDLPAMDDDDLRRGRPTVHKAFDEATAILVGDALQTLAFDVMSEPETHADPVVRCALVAGLARASGIGGMAGGQMLDLEAERSESPLDRPAVERLQAMKTGALLLFSAEAGAIIAAASGPERAALAAYGRALGAAFQIADDLLDAEGDAATLGKRSGKDAARNKATLVATLGLEPARRLRDDLVQRAVDALAPFGSRAAMLTEAARFTAARKS